MRTSRRVSGTASRTPLRVAAAGAAILTLALVWVVPPALAQESGKPKQGAEPAKKPASLCLAVQEVSDPLPVDGGQKDFVTVIKASPTLDTEGDMIVQAILNVRNDGDVPVTVTYRGVLDGDHVHPLTFNRHGASRRLGPDHRADPVQQHPSRPAHHRAAGARG